MHNSIESEVFMQFLADSHITACDRGSELCDPENDEVGLNGGRPSIMYKHLISMATSILFTYPVGG